MVLRFENVCLEGIKKRAWAPVIFRFAGTEQSCKDYKYNPEELKNSNGPSTIKGRH